MRNVSFDASHWIFSTHDPVINVFGGWLADGFNTAPVMDVMISQLPMTKAIETGTPDHQDWHDAVWIVPKDLGVSWTNSDTSGDDPINQTGNITKSGLPILMIPFVEPGKGGTSTHVAAALRHPVELCANHPDQGPKELF